MPKPPEVRLISCQACAVDPGLLPCANADHLENTDIAMSAPYSTHLSQSIFCTDSPEPSYEFCERKKKKKKKAKIRDMGKLEGKRFMTTIYSLPLHILKFLQHLEMILLELTKT